MACGSGQHLSQYHLGSTGHAQGVLVFPARRDSIARVSTTIVWWIFCDISREKNRFFSCRRLHTVGNLSHVVSTAHNNALSRLVRPHSRDLSPSVAGLMLPEAVPQRDRACSASSSVAWAHPRIPSCYPSLLVLVLPLPTALRHHFLFLCGIVTTILSIFLDRGNGNNVKRESRLSISTGGQASQAERAANVRLELLAAQLPAIMHVVSVGCGKTRLDFVFSCQSYSAASSGLQ